MSSGMSHRNMGKTLFSLGHLNTDLSERWNNMSVMGFMIHWVLPFEGRGQSTSIFSFYSGLRSTPSRKENTSVFLKI